MPDIEPGRRNYDQEGGAMVVPLKDYLEAQIEANHREVTAELRHLRADIVAAQAKASTEHLAVTQEIAELAGAVAALRESDNAQHVSFKTIRAIALTVSGVAAFIAAVITAVIQLAG